MAEPTVAASSDDASARRVNHIDRLAAKSAQLKSALGLIWGDGFDAFDSLNKDMKEHYIWLLNDLATDIYSLASDPVLS